MGQIRKDGIIYGGGGNSNTVYLTQAEYDALPDSKLTDGYIYFITDGISGRDIVANGVFIDTTEYLYYETINEGSITRTTYSYTATEDCYASILSNASTSDGVYGILDNNIEVVRNPSNAGFVKVIFPMRKGQIVSFSNLGAYAYFYVMRLIEGTNSSYAQSMHHYSTEEHVVGTWIDGKDIWEKTVAVTTNNTTPFVLATGVSTLISSKGCIGDYSIPAPYFDSNRVYLSVLFAQTAHEVRVYSLGSDYNNLTGYVTIQYTKSAS